MASIITDRGGEGGSAAGGAWQQVERGSVRRAGVVALGWAVLVVGWKVNSTQVGEVRATTQTNWFANWYSCTLLVPPYDVRRSSTGTSVEIENCQRVLLSLVR